MMSADDTNLPVYCDRNVVRFYARASQLQPAERTILESLEGRLPGMRMLDLGVGGGRTTVHFAARVARYVALDYSPGMIAAARERFSSGAHEFILGDARELPFEDATFDFVLFSHNGIDYVEHDDRLRILQEVRRVVRDEGTFVFSTHNLDREDLDLFPRSKRNPIAKALRSFRRARLLANNPLHQEMCTEPHAMINDGAFDFRCTTYHIRLGAQLEQLRAAGFEAIRVYAATTGRELPSSDDVPPTDPWLYFAAQAASTRFRPRSLAR